MKANEPNAASRTRNSSDQPFVHSMLRSRSTPHTMNFMSRTPEYFENTDKYNKYIKLLFLLLLSVQSRRNFSCSFYAFHFSFHARAKKQLIYIYIVVCRAGNLCIRVCIFYECQSVCTERRLLSPSDSLGTPKVSKHRADTQFPTRDTFGFPERTTAAMALRYTSHSARILTRCVKTGGDGAALRTNEINKFCQLYHRGRKWWIRCGRWSIAGFDDSIHSIDGEEARHEN